MADDGDRDLDDDKGHDEPDLPVFAGTFTADADDDTTPLYVALPDLDGGRNDFGPVLWQPRTGETGWLLPQAGDEVRVLETDDDWIVLHWQPAT